METTPREIRSLVWSECSPIFYLICQNKLSPQTIQVNVNVGPGIKGPRGGWWAHHEEKKGRIVFRVKAHKLVVFFCCENKENGPKKWTRIYKIYISNWTNKVSQSEYFKVFYFALGLYNIPCKQETLRFKDLLVWWPWDSLHNWAPEQQKKKRLLLYTIIVGLKNL